MNSTFIEVTLSYPKPTKRENFTCRRNAGSNVGIVKIVVDDDTAPVTDFKCVTRDLEILTCSFKPPSFVAPILYKANYALNGNFLKVNTSKCQKAGKIGEIYLIHSIIFLQTFPIERVKINSGRRELSSIKLAEHNANVTDMSLNFQIFGDNSIEPLEQEFNTTILESLTPKKLQNIQIENANPHEVQLSFQLSKELNSISNMLLFELQLSDEYSKRFEKLLNPQLVFHDQKILLTLNDLKYANSDYELKIRLKSVESPDEEERWSEFVQVTFRTKAEQPEMVPNICDNCYNKLDNGDFMLYWTEVEKPLQNGDEFRYVVQVWSGKTLKINAEATKTHFRLAAGSSSDNEPSKVLIYSKNELGISKNFAQIIMPVKDHVSHSLNIRKELFDNVYKVSWGLLNDADITSYTLVWCSQKDERLNQCDDAVEYRELPLNTSTYSVKALKTFQFGLAANSQYYKSGFQWAKCTTAKSTGKKQC